MFVFLSIIDMWLSNARIKFPFDSKALCLEGLDPLIKCKELIGISRGDGRGREGGGQNITGGCVWGGSRLTWRPKIVFWQCFSTVP